MKKIKDLIIFTWCYIISRILAPTFFTTDLVIIYVIIDSLVKILKGVDNVEWFIVVELLMFIFLTVVTRLFYKLAHFLVMAKKNKNAAITRIGHNYTMLSNKKLRGKSKYDIKNILEDDYKEILDYGLNKYSRGIKITTHSVVIDKLKKLGYGNREQYKNCKIKKKYIIKEKFHMLTFKQFIIYLVALTNPNNRLYMEAQKYLKPHNVYKFIIRCDAEKNIIIEFNKNRLF